MTRIFLFAIGLVYFPALLAQQHAPGHALVTAGGVHAEARMEKGRPFSATVVTRTIQTFLDGTHVNQTTTTMEYRDAEGRVRTETAGNIVIRDPVANVSYRINSAAKSVVKERLHEAGHATEYHDAGGSHTGWHSHETTEDLGSSTINGVLARGTRITIVVPIGALGNDREFRSTYEHWFSSDLNMMIKSISTDPRFGTTTYELTNIKREAPAPALFLPPPSYAVKD
jgi:hypothetical protein